MYKVTVEIICSEVDSEEEAKECVNDIFQNQSDSGIDIEAKIIKVEEIEDNITRGPNGENLDDEDDEDDDDKDDDGGDDEEDGEED